MIIGFKLENKMLAQYILFSVASWDFFSTCYYFTHMFLV